MYILLIELVFKFGEPNVCIRIRIYRILSIENVFLRVIIRKIPVSLYMFPPPTPLSHDMTVIMTLQYRAASYNEFTTLMSYYGDNNNGGDVLQLTPVCCALYNGVVAM